MTKPLIKIFSSDRYNRIDTCNNFFFNPANKEMAGVQRVRCYMDKTVSKC